MAQKHRRQSSRECKVGAIRLLRVVLADLGLHFNAPRKWVIARPTRNRRFRVR